MSKTFESTNGNKDTVTVGTTGTIGSLITQELESIKRTQPEQPQTATTSVTTGITSKKTQKSKSFPSKISRSHRSNGNDPHESPRDASELRGDTSIERNRNGRRSDRKGHAIVEVVDIKCSNPLSSRNKKSGFSKLSESST